MMEKLFAPKAAVIDQHPEWLKPEAPQTKVDQIPEEFVEQLTGEEYQRPADDQINIKPAPAEIKLPEVEIPEHLPNWFEVTAEALDDLSENTALGNLAAVGKMGCHDPRIIKEYMRQIPDRTLEEIEQITIKLACEQSKQLAAHITGRELLDEKSLLNQQKQLKKLFNIANCLSMAGKDQLKGTLIYLESACHFASRANAA